MNDQVPFTLRKLLKRLGVPRADIEQAEAAGTLGLLAADRLILPEARLYTQVELSERSGLGDDGPRLWRALGFPDPGEDERFFTEADLDMVRLTRRILELGLVERDVAFQMARVIGSSMARVAAAQVDALEAQLERPRTEEDDPMAIVRARFLTQQFPQILEYTWRRHLLSAARRRLLRETAQTTENGGVAVGFADLVGFTALSQQVSDHELAKVVERFEAVAFDIVAGLGGRIVKTIGDEVMFTLEDVSQAVEIGLALSETYRDDESLSDVRVGIAAGPALEREGDLYGPTVNLASRIVGIAYEGSVVVSQDVHDTLEGGNDLAWKQLRPRYLKNIGRVRLWVVSRATDDFEESVRDRARRRRDAIRAALERRG